MGQIGKDRMLRLICLFLGPLNRLIKIRSLDNLSCEYKLIKLEILIESFLRKCLIINLFKIEVKLNFNNNNSINHKTVINYTIKDKNKHFMLIKDQVL